jgi:hypothetical protein
VKEELPINKIAFLGGNETLSCFLNFWMSLKKGGSWAREFGQQKLPGEGIERLI